MTIPKSKRPIPLGWLAIAAVVLGLVLVAFFGWRAYRQFDRLQQVQGGTFSVDSLRGWMTVPYIAKTYAVPEADLYEGLGIPAEGNANLNLRQLIDQYKLDPVSARQAIERVILRSTLTPIPAVP